MRYFAILGAALLYAATFQPLAQAAAASSTQNYPDKPIRIIVPYPAGESVDVIARIVTQRWSPLLGQQIIVDNRVGAGGLIGTTLASQATADGYVLLFGNVGTLGITPGLYKNPPYNVLKDFTPVSQIANVPFFLFISPAALPVNSLKDFLAYTKQHPGQVNFASTGIGSGVHLASELFKSLAKIDIVHVPYKGVGQALPELIAGKVQMVFYPLTFGSFVKEGKLRTLMIAATERSTVLPEVPTSAEVGMPEMLASSWHAVVAPRGVPPERIQKLYQTLKVVMADKDVRDKLISNGADPVGSSPEQLDKFMRAEIEKWRKVIQFSGAKAE
jgi:tripartite-type tricarboxylate transporter receptor subunit TctC